ncbi:JAB domain-containing protein [Phragmitibacter flavus]|uniref:JAB domain-containing protein n=1 Tax=Phragmitibacter flavus TaxID=2576071 RepID=A0A5R8KHQ8_9BACT|nr:DNA repair protein RadC [Phragmitibacter flavus]TLD71149.1 JAB domain-containing protein [Phragmitibacter flavus]
MNLRIHDLPENDRPRERLLELGARTLTNAELLAIFINTGAKGENAIQMAQRLLQQYRTLRHLSTRSGKELVQQFRGLGPAKAAHIAAAFELGRRASQEEVREQPMDNPALIHQYLGGDMARLGHETVRILLLNTRMHLTHDEVIFQGSLSESTAHPREILRPAIVHRAHAFILAHNHPSGDPTPSEADRRFTRRLNAAAELLQINFADHLIIGAPRNGAPPYFSFRQAGMI